MEEGSYFDVFTLLVPRSLAEQWPHDYAEGIKFTNNRISIGRAERGEDDKLIVLAQVSNKVVDTWAFCSPPAMLC